MKKKIAIFGPPGVGKSTLIKTALKRGMKAYDFEDFSSEKRRERAKEVFQKDFDGVVLYNAADLQPNDFSLDVERVLLLPPKNVYLKRLKNRDKLTPEKRGQSGPDVYEGFSEYKELFHRVIEVVGSPNKILDKILTINK